MKIAVCGYHGWHDWYLSSNINKKNNLDSHLMANAPIGGVPKNLKDTVFPFEYNNFQQLKKITIKNGINNIDVSELSNGVYFLSIKFVHGINQNVKVNIQK